MANASTPDIRHTDAEREAILRVVSAASFLIFFQSYLVAPLIPALSVQFQASVDFLGMLVPAYMLPYGFSTLFYGPISDRIGRRPVILSLLALMVVTIAGMATAQNAVQMLAWRIVGGVACGGIIPISLALLGDLYPYEQRGRAMGWMFGAIAGGMAFGSTLGALLNPIVGWRAEFLITAGLGAVVLAAAIARRQLLDGNHVPHPMGLGAVFSGYRHVLTSPRGARGYAYVLLNGMFHAGIFAWLGVYFSRRFHLGDEGIGLALLGYGVPGMLLGPALGRLADRFGRKRLIPLGILLAAMCSAALIPREPLVCAALAVTVLSLGYDMSHPLLAGIITSINPARRGLAMGMNAFVLFTGFGLGSLAFEGLLRFGFNAALGVFAAAQFCLAALAIPLFREEDSMAGDHSSAVGGA